jgi:PIN domain nuclease of toxin-antitoxin system
LKYLLDTSTFLWIATGATELSGRARTVYADPANDAYLSIVSVWEILLKHGTGKLPLPDAPEKFIRTARNREGIGSLGLDEAAIFALARLPRIHADPFDRILVCQAQIEGMTILTRDPEIRRYPVATDW